MADHIATHPYAFNSFLSLLGLRSEFSCSGKNQTCLEQFLTKRDEWAGTFEKFIGAGSGSVSGRTTPRTDGARVRAVPLLPPSLRLQPLPLQSRWIYMSCILRAFELHLKIICFSTTFDINLCGLGLAGWAAPMHLPDAPEPAAVRRRRLRKEARRRRRLGITTGPRPLDATEVIFPDILHIYQ